MIDSAFQLLGVTIIYDVEFELHHYRDHGTIEIWLPFVRAGIIITRTHAGKVINGRLNYSGTGAQYDMLTKIYPKNGYTQLWTKEVRPMRLTGDLTIVRNFIRLFETFSCAGDCDCAAGSGSGLEKFRKNLWNPKVRQKSMKSLIKSDEARKISKSVVYPLDEAPIGMKQRLVVLFAYQ